ncbi:16S rRNA (guanine(966)-N(2))-methyltransferase RsmD [bacterium]|nr:16S rRNA (guanine(966)-N(2))-methyltransferase RsmD [bacterium]
MKNNTFKIISGSLKGRNFSFKDAHGLRPTSGKARETLFNWLQFEISGKTILDPFSGTGALGIEALSRGASMVYFIEKNSEAFKTLESNLNLLNPNQYNLINQDSIKYLEKSDLLPFDLIFLDPPFNKGLLPSILSVLSIKNLISTKSKIYIESEYEVDLKFLNSNIMKKCRMVKQKKSGNVHYCLISLEEL